MWRFEHMAWLWAILLVPLLLYFAFWLKKKKEQQLSKFAHPEKLKALIHGAESPESKNGRFLWLMGLVFIVFALANIQLGTEEENVVSKGANVVVALDLSNSMLARDVAPDRLERSKKWITELTERFSGDRVAFIVFAGNAYIQMPFSTDYGAFQMHLRSVNTDMIPTQGTALGDAISLGMDMPGTGGQEEKIFILLSDGEDHDSEAIEMAAKAAKNKMTVHTIGIGTSSGAPIPIKTGGGIAYKKDISGNQILSKLNEDNLKKIAAAGNGKYFNIKNERQALREISRTIKWAAGGTGEEKVFKRYKSYFQWFLLPAILLLMLELWGIGKINLNKKNANSLSALIFGFLLLSSCQTPLHPEEKQAATFFEAGDFKQALQTYQTLEKKDSSAGTYYQIATTFSQLQQPDSALQYYEKALSLKPDTMLSMKIWFNKGNIQYQQRNFKAAAESFQNALKLVPGNYSAQYNLCIALEHLPKSPPDQNPPEQNQDNQDKNEENKDQDKDNEQDEKNKDENQDNKNNQEKEDKKPKEERSDKDQAQQKMSQQDIQQLFETLDRQEKAVQKRVLEKAAEKSGRPYVEKDW